MFKVSIIIPVYNVESYLADCLDSVISQSLKDIQIICVNDGSTDSSLKILEDYQKEDSRIEIITQKNKGLSGSRNTGIKNVKGEYIYFLDSDDWIEKNTLEELYNKSNKLNLDILMHTMVFYYENNKKFEKTEYTNLENISKSFDNKVFDYSDIMDTLFKIPHNTVNKLYKTEFIKDMGILFHEGLNYEDTLFFYNIFPKAKRVSILRKPFYIYRIRDDSICTTGEEKSFDIFKILKLIKQLIEENIIKEKFQEWLLFVIVNLKFVYLRLNDNYKDEFVKLMKDNYNYFQLSKSNTQNWHYEDRAFFESIVPSNNGIEFDLRFKMLKYKFLSNHYKGLYNAEKQTKIKKKSFKEKFKNLVKS